MGKSRKILKIWGKYYGKFGKILLKVRISILDTKSLFPAMDASRRIFLHWLLLGAVSASRERQRTRKEQHTTAHPMLQPAAVGWR